MKTQDTILTIPRQMIGESELIVLPKEQYDEFLRLRKQEERRLWEEKDTDEAMRVYLKEKKAGKLKILRSLADLD
jgi:hypothetical protein